ncbi:hypothetical protein D039_4408A, partial [Vibrio parahaemolyticus EKP-028]
MHAIN